MEWCAINAGKPLKSTIRLNALGGEIEKDYVKAYSWINIAAVKGYGESQSIKDSLAKLMTSEQIDEAQKLSREMIEANPSLLSKGKPLGD